MTDGGRCRGERRRKIQEPRGGGVDDLFQLDAPSDFV